MDLRQYEHYKLAIGDLLRRASPATRHARLANGGGAAIHQHAEDRFNLALIGGFSRGKSSLVNAILGVDRLPTGIVPLTSVITSVSCGTVDRAVLRYKSSILDQDISLTDLREYITQTGNPGNSNGIREAEIQLPAEFLRRGFYFVDTPGLGSAIRENTPSVCPETS